MPTKETILKCCFTGHRPQFFPWGNDLTDIRAQRLLSLLKKEIRAAIDEGFTDFLCGGALGVDTWAAQFVLSLKKEHPSIRLIKDGHQIDFLDGLPVKASQNKDTQSVESDALQPRKEEAK